MMMISDKSSESISVVIGSYNRRQLLPKTIDSVRQNRITAPFEIIVIDGGSSDGTIEWLSEQKDIITIVQHNRGEFMGKPIRRQSWGYFMNLGFKIAQGKYILMISDDCLLLPDTVNYGLECAIHQELQGKRIEGIAFYFRNWPHEKEYYVQKTLGGKLFVNHGLFSKKAMETIGYADESTYMFYKADGDLCLRMWQAGYEIFDCPKAIVEHYVDHEEDVRRSNNLILDHDRRAYMERWKNIFYFPNKKDERGKVVMHYEDKHRIAEKAWQA